MPTKKRGGKREGAGRKPQYGEPTVTISFRVPESKAEEVKKNVGVLLKGWEIKKG